VEYPMDMRRKGGRRYRGTVPEVIGTLASFVVYLAGSVGVTVVFNVPRNNELAALEATAPEAATYWPIYLREWLWWNHVRCVAALLAAAAAAVAIAL
jgi:uncharacterized membrane protein